MRREAAIERIGGADPGAAQPEIAADPSWAEIEKTRRADIGKQPDAGFRHRQHRALGRDAEGAVDRDAGAAAHRDAVDDCDIGLRIAVDMADQLVFLAEEDGCQRAVAGEAAPGLVNRADIAAGAEGALAGAADQDRLDAGVLGPGAQHRIEAAVHVERKGVEGLRPVQRDRRNIALASKQDVLVSHPASQGEDEERVDLAAVEDDKALDKAERHLYDGDLVEIAAGREELAVAVVHDAHRETSDEGLGTAIRDAADLRRADDMAIAVRLEDVGLAHRHDAIGQHALRGGIDDAVAQPGLVALPVGDQITAVLDKEIEPILQPVIVDSIGISSINVADRKAKCKIDKM